MHGPPPSPGRTPNGALQLLRDAARQEPGKIPVVVQFAYQNNARKFVDLCPH